jgi:hypothetical protein
MAKWKVAILDDGQVVHGAAKNASSAYNHKSRRDEPVTWKENFEFDATMKIISYSKGRSSVGFTLEDLRGNYYHMFLVDFYTLVTESYLKRGEVTAKWTFCKRGAAIGLKLAD